MKTTQKAKKAGDGRKRPYVKLMLVDEQLAFLGRTSLPRVRVPIDTLLEEKKREQNERVVSELAGRLIQRLREPASRGQLASWFTLASPDWVRNRRLAFAAAIEAAAAVDLVEAIDSVVAVLEDEGANPLVAAAAAQRIRSFSALNPSARERAFTALRGRVERWQADGISAFVRSGAPSLGLLGITDHAETLAQLVRSAPDVLAWGVLQGLLDWVGRNTARLSNNSEELIFDAVCTRLRGRNYESRELSVALLWVAGGIVPRDQLHELAQLVAESFSQQSLERIAAVNAGKLAIHRFSGDAVDALMHAFNRAQSNETARYLALVVNVGSTHGVKPIR